MIEKLLESLDQKVFTPELKSELEAQFNEAVKLKSSIDSDTLIEEKIDSLNEKSEKYIDMLDEKSEKYIDMLDEKSIEYIDMLDEKSIEYTDMKQDDMVESVDRYLDRIIDEFADYADSALNESLKSEKSEMIIECFDSMLIATGVEVARIVDAKNDGTAENKLEESIEKFDKLIEENISLIDQNDALKDNNDELIKMGVIGEMKEGLSIVKANKFERMAERVRFTKNSSFVKKLDDIKELIKINPDSNPNTDRIDEDISHKKPDWYHLV
jgi:adenylosuccinate synthase